jgi:hypothetical protein
VAKKRLLPTGECWCGCGEETAIGAFFKPGHDKYAEAAVIRLKFGSVADFLESQGFGPGGRNARHELTAAERG